MDRDTRAAQQSTSASAANALTARWGASHRDGDLVFSGVGCWVLLAMLASGAAGETRDELEAAVGLPVAGAQAAAREVLALLDGSSDARAALGVWTRTALDPEWEAGLPRDVLGDLTGDLQADQARLDAWVEQRTDGEIERLPVDVTAETRMVLASALSVNTEWAHPFSSSTTTLATGPWAGHAATGLHLRTRDLSLVSVARGGTDRVTIVRVPGRSDVDVHLFLGDAGTPAGTVLAEGICSFGSGTAVADLAGSEPPPGVTVTTETSEQPDDYLVLSTLSFDIADGHDLLERSELFGLTTAMDGSAGHFPGMSPEPLAVGAAAQHAVARFGEKGFVAAAITAVAAVPGSAMPPEPRTMYDVTRYDVSFDRPFGFAAVHRSSSLVIVAGWVGEAPHAADRHGDGGTDGHSTPTAPPASDEVSDEVPDADGRTGWLQRLRRRR